MFFFLVYPVYLFIYAFSKGLDTCFGVDVFGKGDDGDDAWGTIDAAEDTSRSHEGGAFSGLNLLLGVAPVEASLCDSAYCRRFCALASSATFCDIFESRFSGMMRFEGFVFLLEG